MERANPVSGGGAAVGHWGFGVDRSRGSEAEAKPPELGDFYDFSTKIMHF